MTSFSLMRVKGWMRRRRWKIMRLHDWWIDRVWVPFYCRFHYFHLMRHREDLTYIIVFSFNFRGPEVSDYCIVSSHWTPWGCYRSCGTNGFWERLMEDLGPEGRKAVFEAGEPQ